MTRYKKGDVILVPFPFSDQTTTRKRPAVIISSDTYNNISQDLRKSTKGAFGFEINAPSLDL
jgi:hypothetical protein